MAVHYNNFTAHYPQAGWQCIAVVLLPTAHGQCGGALQEFYYLLPPSSVAPHCTSSPPTAPRHQGGVAVQCSSSTAYCPQVVWLCMGAVPLPIGPRQCGNALQTCHCLLRPGSVEVHCRSSSAYGPRPFGSELHEFHCPLPTGSVAVHWSSFTAYCP